MRVVLHNPHTESHFGKTVSNVLLGIGGFKKYKYFLDYLLKNDKKVVFFLDNYDSSLPKPFSKYFPTSIELRWWAWINKIDLSKVDIITNIEELDKDDIFFSFSLRYLDQEYPALNNISNKNFIKIFHLTHFVQNTHIISENAQKLKVDFIVAENNLQKNSPFFKTFFKWYKKDVYTLPFIFNERFNKKVAFADRQNKCLATGTIIKTTETHDPSIFKDFHQFYKTTVLQPLRNSIFINYRKLNKEIDSYISEFYENKLKKEKTNNFFKKFSNRFYNVFIANKRSYFKFNIVEKYNSHKMFVNGEEINDLPGIGFVEGMACGAAYIGKKDPMYTNLGLIPGIHYIGYKGTLIDLISKIRYFQKHSKQLEKIADTGYKFVIKKFNGEQAAKTFYQDLEELLKDYKKNGYNKAKLVFKSSFVEL